MSLLVRSLVVLALLAGEVRAQAAGAAVRGDSTHPAPTVALRDSTHPALTRKSPVAAGVLGLMFAGSGHWYAGEGGRGTLVAAVYFPCAFIVMGGRTDRVGQACGATAIGALGFSVVDGIRAVRRFNRRHATAAPPAPSERPR